MTKKSTLGTLHVSVMEGRNLIPMDSDGQSDPYCVVIVGEKKKRTKAVRHKLNPKWENEHYEFTIDPTTHSLLVEVYDWDRFSSDDRMGMVSLPIQSLLESTLDTIKWYPLVPIKPDDKVTGDLRLKIRFDKEKAEKDKNPFIKAIKDHDLVAFEHLLAKPKTDINVCDTEGVPATHLIAVSNNIQMLMIFLKSSDLKITSRDIQGNTPLHLFAQKCIVSFSEEPINKLIERGCSVNHENAVGEIPLHKSCLSQNQKTQMMEILIAKGSGIDHKTKNEETPLHYAIKMGRPEFARCLLQRGADFTLAGGNPPKKPLDLAKELNHTQIVHRIQQTQEISDWLQNLQLDSLIPIFLMNDMFMDVVTDIDETTLDSLKITVAGQRAKLLKAVKKLKAGEPLDFSSSSLNLSSLQISSESVHSLDSLASSHCNNSHHNSIRRSSDIVIPTSPNHNNIVSPSTPRSLSHTGSSSSVNNLSSTNLFAAATTAAAAAAVSSSSSSSVITSTNVSSTTTTNIVAVPTTPVAAAAVAVVPVATTTTTTTTTTTAAATVVITTSPEKPNIEYSDLAQLKHTHLDHNDTTWIIDETNLQYSTLLGVGASGKVYKGFYKGEEVAIKVLKSFTDKKDIEEFKKEFQIVSALKSPGVVYFFGAGIKDKLCIVMEYCSRGSLYHILKDETVQFSWKDLFHLALQAVNSLNSLHTWSPQILHRDLKSLNLLITENWTVKICDFGLSRFDTGSNLETLGKLRGTYAYVAPEVYFGNKYTLKSDVYSMGMIIWEMLYRCLKGAHQFPFGEYLHLKFDYQILIACAKKDLRPTFPPETPASLIEIISRTLLKDATLRPTTQELYDALLEIRDKEFNPNAAEWEAKRFVPDQQLNPQPDPPPTAAVSPSLVGTGQFDQLKPKSALPDHLTRSRSNSSPIEPSNLKKKPSKFSLLQDH
ncbi:ankyrin repeat-containing protein [Cavenderia fasciculata]|uniref:non-specific serine/threonine protein kinase n=1 Tax=Cavenderia fasciculata TaxID=261658 RepID=F4PWV9_CACFS|nr:ankyrin repeat-containing protein [Cavenderia fasciculata]EGG19762.1 ankyrin repeat-containing protein [Cavenderia fasciculata]|eukprot:XP_004358108.1 ankyrin repeat-containing protein [Cavenderia fasciculata]